jgi:glyoxylate reductase
MKKHILFGARLPGDPHKQLSETFTFDLPQERVFSQEELESRAADAHALVTLLSHRVDGPFLDRFPNVEIISNYAVGFNNIDVGEATRRGVIVTNTPDVLTETTADLAWALMMAAARRIVEADGFMREGKFIGWTPWLFLGSDIWGKCLGIIGFGRIGRAVARRAAGFGMRVLYYDPEVDVDGLDSGLSGGRGGGLRVEKVSLEDLLKESDFISIHCPLVPATRHLIGPDELSCMKSSSFLINTARGPVVDEKALVEALNKGVIAGAGLDVYEKEPETTQGLLELSNVVVAPHIGSGTRETRKKMALMAVNAVFDFFSSRRPENVVNPEALNQRAL